ncbi:MAG TPA: aldo/keto reductase [Acidimicrobiales bacterium]|nr:aldo/keto reductase [Acidimicrobiales bacterium]
MSLPTATLGRTGVAVSKLGYGAMELRSRNLDPSEVDRLLNGVLDAGINMIDTSPDYGASEEHIGRALSGRRDEYFLASKCGCPVGEPVGEAGPAGREHVFTRANVRAGVEQSLSRMRTDHLDLVQFHMSPSPATLAEDDAVAELVALRDEGKIRFLGISGTLPNLPDQIAMGVFDAFQIPYSAVEREHETAITSAAEAGGGTIIRGGVARGFPEPPAEYPERYREMMRARNERFNQTDISDLLGEMTPMEFMLRFTLSHPDMHTTIVGTKNPDHLAANVAAASNGPLPTDVYDEAKRRFDRG